MKTRNLSFSIAVLCGLFSNHLTAQYTQAVSITTDTDAVLEFINDDGSWQYIEFNTNSLSPVRNAYLGITNSGNFVFAKENGGNFYFTGGNVGIGATTPSEKLEVNGNLLVDGARPMFFDPSKGRIYLKGITNGWSMGLFADESTATNLSGSLGGFGIYGTTDVVNYYWIGESFSNPEFLVKPNGNVGIGTTNTSAKLTVEGDLHLNGDRGFNFNTSKGRIYLKADNTGWNMGLLLDGPSALTATGSLGGFGVYGTGDAVNYYYVGESYANPELAILPSGNVGIGTSSPGTKFDVKGNIRTRPGSGGTITVYEADGTRKNRLIISADQDGSVLNSTYGTGGSQAIIFKRSSVETMRIADGGNVGIGTTTPAAKLDVKGQDVDFISSTSQNTMRIGRGYNEYFKLNVNDYTGYLDYHQDSDGDRDHVFYIRNMALGNSANNDIRFQTDSIDRMTIKTNGNIGIGTTSPEGNLQIGSGTTQGLVLIGGGKGKPAIASTRSDGGLILGKNIYTKYDNASENSIGRVAISSSNGISGIKMSHNGVIDFFGVKGSVTADAIANDDSNIKMKINEDGNVSIGTIDPGTYKLAVEGQIGARSIKVTEAAWADYVFAPSYQLMPLSEVEAYITKNQHLPNVPSAKEIEEKGFVLEEMDAKLMEKIEELTLYMIEQQKQNTQQTNIIKKQEEQIKSLQQQLDALSN